MKSPKRWKLNISSVIICIAFFAVLIVLPVVTIALPKKSFSDIENKSLQSMPSFSVKTLFNRTFTDDIESYISDHFVGRTSWIKIKSGFEAILGKKEQNGIYILEDRLIEKIDELDYDEIDKSIAAIDTFAKDNDVPVYMMLVPTSAEFYKNQLPDYMPNLDQRQFIEYVYDKLDDSISLIDVYPEMAANAGEYIYYRTDHHWTSLGAYIAYAAASRKMGYTPLEYSEYNIEHASTEFQGTFYSKTLCDNIEKDTIDFYSSVVGEKPVTVEVSQVIGEEPEIYDSMYFREYLNVKDKYSAFLGQNAPVVTIKTDNDGGRLLIIKDSYAHCYAPFLAENYSEITLLDMRYIQISYKSVVNVSDYDQVLFLYNVSSFADDIDLKKLMYE
ncbi:MAG: hypothetical protein LUI05_05400 [Oscillospiraceae bacterium]|nr:hypothetical protein [Oscillospiraceae bacterium]